MKPVAVKPKIPKGRSGKLSCLAFNAHPKLGKQIQSYMAKNRRLELKVQSKAEGLLASPAEWKLQLLLFCLGCCSPSHFHRQKLSREYPGHKAQFYPG